MLQRGYLAGGVIWALALAVGAFLVPSIRDLLNIVPLSVLQWVQVLGVALLLLVTVEVGKWISNYRHRSKLPSRKLA